MRFVNQLYYYLPSVCRAISNAVTSPKDYGQTLQNSNKRRKGANK